MKSILLALHAHLPYVRHPEWNNFLEEQWLFEAVTETYVPLVMVLEELRRENKPVRLTLTLSPTLLLMLDDQLLHDRTVRYVESRLRLLAEESERHNALSDPFRPLVKLYRDRYEAIRDILDGRGGLLRAFRALESAGLIEIVTCAATHGFLPHLMMSPGSVERQVATGCRVHERILGHRPKGIWLPECGFTPGIESILAKEGLEYFFVESHGIELAAPGKEMTSGDPLVPVKTPSGPVAFGRDRETSKAVWSAEEGYPGDFSYRDFYRDVGFDLPTEVVAPYMPPAIDHTFTGIKYHRITGSTDQKELYNRGRAIELAHIHAMDFVNRAQGRLGWLKERGMETPLIVCPYDAELFGHWWFEGIDWIGQVFREIALAGDINACTASDYLNANGQTRNGVPAHSSWGDGGYGEVWGSAQAEWIYPHIYGLNHHLRRLKVKYQHSNDAQIKRALVQFERELLLLESSDWPFILHTGTQTGYAKTRLAEHIEACGKLKTMLEIGEMDMNELTTLEWKHPSFSESDLRIS
jgi:1,4-alpha-glucan branching enzyme